MTDAGALIRETREESGLSLRALADRSDVSYPTICRIERGQMDPTTGTLRKLLGAMGAELQLERRTADSVPQLADLHRFWSTDNTGQDQPDWTRLRSFLDFLSRRPELSASAVRAKPPASGSDFFDSLLAGIAEKVSDDTGNKRPAWTKAVLPLETTWESFGTPRMRADAEASTPPQLAARQILIPEPSLWRQAAQWATTDDVDSVSQMDEELRAAVEKVALENDLAPDWLNEKAAPFTPNTLDAKACDQLLDHPRLLVLGAPLREVFLMKIYPGWPNDHADMVTMWPHIGFTSAQEVVDAFWVAYPHAPDDPHLDQFVREIAARAGVARETSS